jgi:hypothetical protein
MNSTFKTKLACKTMAVAGLMLLAMVSQAAPDAAPTVQTRWKMDLPAGTKGIAIADVRGDGSPRLMVLDADGVLTVNRFAEAALTKEDTISLGKQADQFAVGQFAKNRPAVIIVPGAIYYRDGDKYSKKTAADITTIAAVVRLANGTEVYVPSIQGMPHGYTIDLAAANPVVEGDEMESPERSVETYRTISLSIPPDLLAQAPFPQEVKKGGGILRLFVPEKSKTLYGLASWQTDTSNLALIDATTLFSNGSPGDLKPLWKSDKLAGKILDIAFGPSLKDGKQNGIYVLEASGDDGKARQLEFFSIQ